MREHFNGAVGQFVSWEFFSLFVSFSNWCRLLRCRWRWRALLGGKMNGFVFSFDEMSSPMLTNIAVKKNWRPKGSGIVYSVFLVILVTRTETFVVELTQRMRISVTITILCFYPHLICDKKTDNITLYLYIFLAFCFILELMSLVFPLLVTNEKLNEILCQRFFSLLLLQHLSMNHWFVLSSDNLRRDLRFHNVK